MAISISVVADMKVHTSTDPSSSKTDAIVVLRLTVNSAMLRSEDMGYDKVGKKDRLTSVVLDYYTKCSW